MSADSIVDTVIFPVAGLGTRFMPATKATPKELLPVLDRPLVQYAIDEARAAGVKRMIFVNHPSKSAIEAYVRQDDRLDAMLRGRGKADIADTLKEMALGADEEAHFVMQEEPLGLGHAVLCARALAGDKPVAIMLPDDLILGPKGCLGQMIDAYAAGGVGHLVATMRVSREDVSKYGVLKPIDAAAAAPKEGSIERAEGMVEKPAPDAAPSRSAVIGRYVLHPSIFEALETQTPGAGGEIQLTDAIARTTQAVGLGGFHFAGQRFDCGSKAGMVAATLHVAAQDDACAKSLAEWSGADATASAA